MHSTCSALTDRAFDAAASRERCRKMRLRILEISQKLSALHIAPAFSCLEIVDSIYFGLMRRRADGACSDTFIMSKGHGAMAQYAALEQLGILTPEDLDMCCQPGGRLGAHPDYGLPGIEASTGSLGHGLPMALGICIADRERGLDSTTYVIMSDGELMEGSTWEALLAARNLRVSNLVVFVDFNGFVSATPVSVRHPNVLPIEEKFRAFGWSTRAADGHNAAELFEAASTKDPDVPLVVVATTTKGKGVSYMENHGIWHYRSPNQEEYLQARRELGESA